ncbi:MAG: L-threonylcarbamoyladenylate synthase [Candidatus Limnocylindrales bacterium]
MTGPRVVGDSDAGRIEAIRVLEAGGLVAIPTDTVYGLAVHLRTPGGIERLFAAKGRSPDKAITVLVDALDQVERLVELPDAALTLASTGWPGGLTLVLPLRRSARLPRALTADTRTLGVRLPDHATPRALARAVGPLPTTSANRSGEPDAHDAAEAAAALGAMVDLVLDGGRARGGAPSTVVDCTVRRPRVLRAGAIPAASLAAALDAAGLAHDLRG